MPARGKKKAKSGPSMDKTKDDDDDGAASSSSDVETDAKKDKAPTTVAATSSPSSSTAAVDEAAKHHRIELLSHAYRKTSVAKAFGNAVAELVQENPRLQDSIGEMVLLLDEVSRVTNPSISHIFFPSLSWLTFTSIIHRQWWKTWRL